MACSSASKRAAKTFLLNFMKCEFVFYASFYLCETLSHGSFRLDMFDPRSVFDFITWIDLGKCCSFSLRSKVNLLSLVAAFVLLLILLAVHIRKAHWLYVLSVSAVHVIVSCIVMLDVPKSYSYWICLGVAAFACIATADIVVFFLEDNDYHLRTHKPNKIQSSQSS